MRRVLYVVLGLALFAGATFHLYKRQFLPTDLGDYWPSMTEASPESATKSGERPSFAERRAERPEIRQRRIDRGIQQYRRPDGTWNKVSAVIDVLNVVVGIIGIGLAIAGMRDRREARRSA